MLKRQHKLLSVFNYPLSPIQRGYANRTLFINLGTGLIRSKPVTDQMKRVFTGGKGFCLWLLWNAISADTRWHDPENELVFACGPIGGTTSYPGAGKVTVVTLSPLTSSVIDSNGGGHFGPFLKFSGWDALEVQGKCQEDTIVFIDGDNGTVALESAVEYLPVLDANPTSILALFSDGEEDLRNYTMVFTGKAADHISMCGLNVSYYDQRRKEVHIKQCARGGAGRVFRDKRLAAIIIRYSNFRGNQNGEVNNRLLHKAGKRMNKEIHDLDAFQNDMRGVGTPYLIEVTNHFNLLPVENYRFGSHADHINISGEVWNKRFDHSNPDNCWYGCTMACSHSVPHFHPRTGPDAGKAVRVDGPEYETLGAVGSNCGIFDPNTVLEINYYADTYGIDTISLGNSIAFVMECFEYGILRSEQSGGLGITWGNDEAVLELIHQMADGKGFGMIVGQGIRFMKQYFTDHFGANPNLLHDIGMEVKGLEISEYVTKESLAQQGGYGLALKGAQHDENCMVFMDQVRKELPTIEEKAEAICFFSLFRTWFSLHGLCRLPWNDITPESNRFANEPSKFPEHIENYTWLYEGVTGTKATTDDLLYQSEKVYNFQRIFNLRMGFGTRKYDYLPYRAMGPVTEKEYLSNTEYYDDCLRKKLGHDPCGSMTEEKIYLLRKIRQDEYDRLIDAVYQKRGWTREGIPTKETIRRLEIDFPEVLELLEKYNNV